MIKVRIETASAVTRAGLEVLVGAQPEMEVVGTGGDVVITEDLPDLALPSVLLNDETPAREALRAGARAVLSRDAAPAQIIAAIYAAAAGLIAVPASDRESLPVAVDRIPEPLTPRESEVLEMLGEGLSNKLIAYRLSISEHTAKFHVNSILAKLGAGTRAEAVMRGIRSGLIKI
jgi:DNA-binding NarL/FixJ family response regulator